MSAPATKKQCVEKSLKGIFLGIGNPLLDIIADVDQKFLDKYALKMNNAILCEDKHKPIYKEIVEAGKVQYMAGGATQNSVRVAQWMLQEEGATGFIGCVGNDDYGKQLQDCAEQGGVAVHYLKDDKEATGTCAALVMEKERSLVANLSAANLYKKDHFDSEPIQKVLETAQYVYSAGFFLTVSPPTLQAIGEHCVANDKVFMVNLAAEFITDFFADPLLTTIGFADYVFGNESEAAAFAVKQKYSDKSVKNVAIEIAKLEKKGKKPRTVIITQGADPTIVVKDGKVTEYPVDKLAPADIVDVNGAGDSFVGGFVAALIKGKSEKECVEAGHYAASIILKVSGCAFTGKPDAKYL